LFALCVQAFPYIANFVVGTHRFGWTDSRIHVR
jgi:hypothetical protein